MTNCSAGCYHLSPRTCIALSERNEWIHSQARRNESLQQVQFVPVVQWSNESWLVWDRSAGELLDIQTNIYM